MIKTDELFKEITKPIKWYVGYYSQQTASAICKRYKAGTLSQEKIEELFNKFGYIKNDVTWEIK